MGLGRLIGLRVGPAAARLGLDVDILSSSRLHLRSSVKC